MSLDHPYRSIRVPSDAPFELRPSPGKGWGAFATRRIERGALILREEPLFVDRKPGAEITRQDASEAFRQLTPSQKQQCMLLRDNASKGFTSMLAAFTQNSFTSNPDNGPPHHGLYLLLSRFNHSCIPNSYVSYKGDEVTASYATRHIVVDEEITTCYKRGLECQTRRKRHEALHFVCECKACLPGTPFHKLSEVRRQLIRGLSYLTKGVDIDGKRQTSVSPIITDPRLKMAAETHRIPLSSILIYEHLIVVLLEEEDLLCDVLVERISLKLLRLVNLFQTEDNARIARLTMAQGTWLERLDMAFRLDGRGDAYDCGYASLLRYAVPSFI
ncbi:hypothetical protein F4677DRAFT_3840 [Hypoxylon crocopeplum]|nr:hypothetical protein F4677DRAFT_3840 [Hypoxylon crocopeplum]